MSTSVKLDSLYVDENVFVYSIYQSMNIWKISIFLLKRTSFIILLLSAFISLIENKRKKRVEKTQIESDIEEFFFEKIAVNLTKEFVKWRNDYLKWIRIQRKATQRKRFNFIGKTKIDKSNHFWLWLVRWNHKLKLSQKISMKRLWKKSFVFFLLSLQNSREKSTSVRVCVSFDIYYVSHSHPHPHHIPK